MRPFGRPGAEPISPPLAAPRLALGETRQRIAGQALFMRLSTLFRWLSRDAPATPPPSPRETLLSATFEHADVGIAHIGLDGKILRVNANLRATLGYQEQDIVGLDKTALFHRESRAAVEVSHQALCEGVKTSSTGERVFVTRDGTAVSALTSARRIGDPPRDSARG